MAEYIDKQAVLDDLANLWDWETVDGIQSSTVLRQVMTDVRNVPTADVRENKHGHWIETEDGDLQCSECGHLTDDWVDIFSSSKRDCVSGKRAPMLSWATKHPYFCGKCGADMRGEK